MLTTITPRRENAFERWVAGRLEELEGEWLRRQMTDGCPRCGQPVAPASWAEEASGFRARYRCSECGWAWWTGWSRRWVEEGGC